MYKIEVLNYFGTIQKLVDAMKKAGHPITQPAISAWNDKIPELRAFQIERITNGELKNTH